VAPERLLDRLVRNAETPADLLIRQAARAELDNPATALQISWSAAFHISHPSQW
jgi:hypothetical protein